MVSINGQELATPECEALITAAVEKWHIQTKKRRKIPRNIPISQSTTALPAMVVPEVDVTDGGIQTETPKVVSASDVEVARATAALNLTTDHNEQVLGENWLWK